MNDKIDKLYFNPKFPASFTSLDRFYVEAKKKIPKLTRKDLKKWSIQSATYTTHKSARKNFKRTNIHKLHRLFMGIRPRRYSTVEGV